MGDALSLVIEQNKNKIIEALYLDKNLSSAQLLILLSQNYTEIISMLMDLIHEGLVARKAMDSKIVHYLTKKGLYKYIYENKPNYIKNCFECFYGYNVNYTYVEEFLMEKFYDLYLNDDNLDLNTIVDDYSNYALEKGYIKRRLKK